MSDFFDVFLLKTVLRMATPLIFAASQDRVDAIKLLLSRGADARLSSDADVNSGRLQRSFTNIITLRNRVP